MSRADPGVDARRRVPTQARAQERVARILEAARAELQRRPAAEVRSEDIARRAGVPVGSLYQYFDSKTAILAAVAEMVVGEADAAAADQLAACMELPWRDAMDRVLDSTFDFYRDSPHYERLLHSIRNTPEFERITAESNRRMADLVALHPAFARAGIPKPRAVLICRVVITAGNALQDQAFTDAELPFEAWRDEARVLVRRYLEHHLP